MKKYYGYFVYNGEPYVIRFKVDGNLRWDGCDREFIGKYFYIWSSLAVIAMAALDTHFINDKRLGSIGLLCSHKDFKQYRANGVKRWTPKKEVIKWDDFDFITEYYYGR